MTAAAAGRPRVALASADRARWLLVLGAAAVLGAIGLRVGGLPKFDPGGPLHSAGIPCPFCGGTRGTLALANGDVGVAWSWNPVVPLLAILVVAVIVRAVVGRLTGRWVEVFVPRKFVLGAAMVGLVALQVNQSLQAERLLGASA
ncbi:DUF2752 domain-containing protein [Iamia sp. SCSIO 61187]|nr:DUF2752 domain-containing protein [Iamia sp. SCSIO 61187]